MGTKKRDEVEQSLRAAMRAAMKAGAEVGYDRAVKLAEKIEEGFGDESGIARELRKMRDRVIADMHASIEKETA